MARRHLLAPRPGDGPSNLISSNCYRGICFQSQARSLEMMFIAAKRTTWTPPAARSSTPHPKRRQERVRQRAGETGQCDHGHGTITAACVRAPLPPSGCRTVLASTNSAPTTTTTTTLECRSASHLHYKFPSPCPFRRAPTVASPSGACRQWCASDRPGLLPAVQEWPDSGVVLIPAGIPTCVVFPRGFSHSSDWPDDTGHVTESHARQHTALHMSVLSTRCDVV